MTHEDLCWNEYLRQAREFESLERLGLVCAGCEEHCGQDQFQIKPGEEYCAGCAMKLALFAAEAS